MPRRLLRRLSSFLVSAANGLFARGRKRSVADREPILSHTRYMLASTERRSRFSFTPPRFPPFSRFHPPFPRSCGAISTLELCLSYTKIEKRQRGSERERERERGRDNSRLCIIRRTTYYYPAPTDSAAAFRTIPEIHTACPATTSAVWMLDGTHTMPTGRHVHAHTAASSSHNGGHYRCNDLPSLVRATLPPPSTIRLTLLSFHSATPFRTRLGTSSQGPIILRVRWWSALTNPRVKNTREYLARH